MAEARKPPFTLEEKWESGTPCPYLRIDLPLSELQADAYIEGGRILMASAIPWRVSRAIETE